jgi:hypothetical protein
MWVLLLCDRQPTTQGTDRVPVCLLVNKNDVQLMFYTVNNTPDIEMQRIPGISVIVTSYLGR